jgi:hypothetical protein
VKSPRSEDEVNGDTQKDCTSGLTSRPGMLITGQWLRLALSKAPNRVGVFYPSPEDGNRSTSRNVQASGISNS